MDFEKNKVSQDDLENVSGGEIIETKDGKFIWTPLPIKKFYDKKEDAEKAETELKKHINIPKVMYGLPRVPKQILDNPVQKVIKKNNSDDTNK